MGRDTYTCSVCKNSMYSDGYKPRPCDECGATLVLLKIMDDILEEHYEELEAAGADVFANVPEPPVIPYLRSLWLEKEELKKKHDKLGLIIKNVDSALREAKGFV